MPKLVVILGAGASADFGVPTLSQLFKDSYARQYLQQDPWLADCLNKLFWEPRGHSLETSDQSLTVEEMLTVFRDWELETNIKSALPADELARFRKSLYVLIYRALFVGKSTRREYLNPLIELADKYFDQTTWATFNWDCIFESSFWYASGPWGLGTRRNPSLSVKIKNWNQGGSKHRLLKLHGGINWWIVNGELTYLRFSGSGALAEKWQSYRANPTADRPVILEPSFYKYQDAVYSWVEPQWSTFLERLIEADYILIVGYSLPTADAQARSKLMTAFQANPNNLWGVVDPNKSSCERYARLFGRKRLKITEKTLAGFNNELSTNFTQLFPTFSLPAPLQPPAVPGSTIGENETGAS
jgi:hypothetical protein